jgi:hypothetical protein
MSGSDIFSLSFLCCLGISLLLIGLLSIYFNNKLTEQEHKISAMFGIVTTMADQIQFLRTNRNVIADPSKNGLDVNNYSPFENSGLINVSDDEGDDGEDEDEDGDDTDDDSSTSSSSSSNSSINEPNIRVINISEDFDINNEVNEMTEITELLEQKDHKETDKKMVDIDVDSETDYKKMSLGKLRQIVSEKGVSSLADVSKLKKAEILKLLSVENV